MTTLLFREDPYLRSASANVAGLTPDGSVILDQTIFYAQGGGQPGDTGHIVGPNGVSLQVAETVYAPDRTTVLHRLAAPEDAAALTLGQPVRLELDWDKRLGRMRIHTAMHLLTVVLTFPVTGGSIGDGEGRVDFDMPAGGPDRETIEAELSRLIEQNADVTTRWITDDELLANPGLVKTMSVRPPMGSGRVRLVQIGDIDLQPCGGTHVANTAEIGAVSITGIEKKGKQNRRVRLRLPPQTAITETGPEDLGASK